MPQPIDSQGFLPKTHFLDILEIFRLGMEQISSSLLKKGIYMTACLSFHWRMTFLLWRAQKSKFCDLRL